MDFIWGFLSSALEQAGVWYLFVCVFAYRPLHSILKSIPAVRPEYIAATLVVLTVLARGWFWWTHANSTFGVYSVGGMPFSDARGWDRLASNFAFGHPIDSLSGFWDARRPFYAYFFGSLYALFGVDLIIVKCTHFIFAVISTILIWDALRRLSSPVVAICGALTHIFYIDDCFGMLTTLSESLGYFLSNLCLWALAYLLTIGCARTRILMGCVAGLAFGLSNLTRTLSLLGIGAIPVALVFVGRARAVQAALTMVLVSIVICGSWFARNWIVHGIPSLSDNSAEMFYAATSPKYQTWSGAISSLYPVTGKEGLHDRYVFFQEGVRNNLRTDPSFYARNALRYFMENAKRIFVPPLILLLSLIVAVTTLSRPPSLFKCLGIAACAVGFAFLPPDTYLAPLFFISVFNALVRRSGMVVPAVVVLTSLMLVGLSAFEDYRAVYGLQWLVCGCCTDLIATLFREKDDIESARPWHAGTVMAAQIAATAAIGALILGAGIATWRMFQDNHLPSVVVEPEKLEPPCKWGDTIAKSVQVRRGRISRGYYVEVYPGERFFNYSNLFDPRPYPFSIFETVLPIPEVYVAAPSSLAPKNYEVDYIFYGVPMTDPQNGESHFEVHASYVIEQGHPRLIGCAQEVASQRVPR